MASGNLTAGNNNKGKMAFKPVDYDVNEIAPDAPEGAWNVSIPRGEIQIKSTKDDDFPVLYIPIRLDKYVGEEEGEQYEKALGTKLMLFITFFGNANPRADRMNKLRLRQLCEAADVDLETVPTKIRTPEDFAELVAGLEGKKFPAWTVHRVRKDTGETQVDMRFVKPGGLAASGGGDDEEETETETPTRGRGRAGKRK
jgi:hypothetical protein